MESFADLPQDLQDYSNQHMVTPDVFWCKLSKSNHRTHGALQIGENDMPQSNIGNKTKPMVPNVGAETEPPELRHALQVTAAKLASNSLKTRVDKQKAFADALSSGRCPDWESL